MALPDAWVDHLFRKLAVRYGDAWVRKWDGLPMSAVRTDWAHVLDGMSGQGLTYGLEHLPDEFPPTVAAFRSLCIQRPVQQPLPQLPAPTEHQLERLRELREKLHSLGESRVRDPRAWARRLIERHESRAHIATPLALEMARAASGARLGEMGAIADPQAM